MLFADLSGTATFSHSFVDFDSDNLTFGMDNSEEFDVSLDLFSETVEAMGEGDVYASINATLTVSLLEESTGDGVDEDTTDSDTASNDLGYYDIDFDYDAYVMGDGWALNIASVMDPVDYAADITALDDDDDAYNYSVAGNTIAGVSLALDDLGTVTFGLANGQLKALKETDIYLGAETASMELAEGLTAKVGATVLYDNELDIDYNNPDDDFNFNFEAGLSAMVDYVMDDMTVSFAIDGGLDNFVGPAMDTFLSVETGDLSLSAYYGTENANADFDFDETSGLDNSNAQKVYDDDQDPSTDEDDDLYSVSNLLNLVVDYDFASLDLPLSVNLTALDIINTQDFDAQIDYSVNDMLSPYVTAGYEFDTDVWCVGAGVTYTTDMYTADASVSYDKNMMLAMAASVESTTLVDGATLTLSWDDADDLLKKSVDSDPTDPDANYGSVSFTCEIAF
jgi:hypothetical protein